MAAPFRTYLDLCNTILRELNEVELTSTTFTSALCIQKFVKDTSIFFIEFYRYSETKIYSLFNIDIFLYKAI